MEHDSNKSEERKREVARIIDEDDISPDKRALYILTTLQDTLGDNLKEWDMICFAVEFLGLMTTVYPWLNPEAKALAKRVYTAHYLEESYKNVESGITTGRNKSSESKKGTSGQDSTAE